MVSGRAADLKVAARFCFFQKKNPGARPGQFLEQSIARDRPNHLPQLHSQRADAVQGGGPETALQTPPTAFFAPMHQALQSNVSGCPRSFPCTWITPAPGLDSINIKSLLQASPKDRPLG